MLKEQIFTLISSGFQGHTGNSWGSDVKSQQFLSTVAFDTIYCRNKYFYNTQVHSQYTQYKYTIQVHSQPSYLWALHLQNHPASENMVYNGHVLSEAHLS